MGIYLVSKSLLSLWICLPKSQLKNHTTSVQTKARSYKSKPFVPSPAWCFCLANNSVDRIRELRGKSPCWGSCQCPFLSSAFVCLQVNVVTKLGIEVDLQITQYLLYRWHSFLKAFDLLLQCFLITEHKLQLDHNPLQFFSIWRHATTRVSIHRF